MNAEQPTFIESLQTHIQPVAPQDTMAEAGRKALLNDFIKMLEHETGSRSGEDPEDVHDMRVSTRRMRSTLHLLASYYKPKAIQPYLDELKRIAETLGEVRDLDVMIADLKTWQEKLDAEGQAHFQPIIDQLDDDRSKARQTLIRLLDKGAYRRFVEDFSVFLTKPGKGALPVDLESIQPFQVRHLLPNLIYQHLATVRAYDAVLADADEATLHALRIEFKRLRYAVSIFSDVLGSSINDFINELKTIQDHLGKIADIRAFKDRLKAVANKLNAETQADTLTALQQYLDQISADQDQLHDGFGAVWKHFNSKSVQRQLANAVASL